MGSRTFLVDGGDLVINDRVTIGENAVVMDQFAREWVKPDPDKPWRLRATSERAPLGEPIGARFVARS